MCSGRIFCLMRYSRVISDAAAIANSFHVSSKSNFWRLGGAIFNIFLPSIDFSCPFYSLLSHFRLISWSFFGSANLSFISLVNQSLHSSFLELVKAVTINAQCPNGYNSPSTIISQHRLTLSCDQLCNLFSLSTIVLS